MPSSTSNPSPHRQKLHKRRTRVILWIGAVLLVVLGLGWAVFFTTQGAWAMVAMDLLMVTVGAAIAVLTHYKRTRSAFFM
ncbi:MAG: hypothetical protein K2Q97_10665, partial [Burkholderiaceae bacterium]|nr:hypothetical protein [Burkholderiaceae bacterium]